MKKKFSPVLLLSFCLLFILGSSFTVNHQTATPEYYQLTIYHFKNDAQLATTSAYLKNVYLPALHKNGLSNIGVFSSLDNDTSSDKKMYMLVPFSSMKKFESFANMLSAGILLKGDTSAYGSAAYSNAPYVRMENIILKAFKDMLHLQKPSLTAPLNERVYELRSYEAATEKLYRQKIKMFNDGGEVGLFNRLQFNAVFYAEVLSGSHMPNLMYMTTFDSKISRDEHWKNFVDDSVWKRISVMPEYLNTVSKADIFFLRPTDYSDF